MNYDELREEFSDEVEKAKDELEEYGILLDLERELSHEEGFQYFVETPGEEDKYMSRALYEGFNDRQFLTWSEDELPKRVK